tara:strand:- start:470 stop:1417 length:948 start_codon:yes stop_codon:yes gene_type:complete
MTSKRHPEKQRNIPSYSIKKPDWLKVKAPSTDNWKNVKNLMNSKSLVTVCEEAACPNIGECWSKKHATMMILGDICTRACAFCNIKTGNPYPVDISEPIRVAEAVFEMELEHVVITSVDRDDLDDGGATQFANTIKEIRKKCPSTTIEILTPDFRNKSNSLDVIISSKPDVFNHNLETVPSLYNEVRPGARYFSSLKLLNDAKQLMPGIFTKSGIMVGLGEIKKEVLQLMDDLRAADVDFLTIGQYLQPTPMHFPIKNFITPEEFNFYKKHALGKGFLMVSASPLTRSSYHASEDFQKLKKIRNQTSSPFDSDYF